MLDEKRKKNPILYKKILAQSIIKTFLGLNPASLIKNPVVLFLTIYFLIFIYISFYTNIFSVPKSQILFLEIILFLNILTIIFSETLSREIGKSQIENLKIIYGDIEVKKINSNNEIEYLFASELKKGDVIKVQEGDLIPLDGEIIDGVATVDESAITGESSPVLKEPGTDTASSVTSGTRVLNEWLLVKITSTQGETYLDQMIDIAEENKKNKFDRESKLNRVLVFISFSSIVLVALLILGFKYTSSLSQNINVFFLLFLLPIFLPTTTSGLVIPATISGFDKFNALNVIATSKKVIENVTKVNYLFLDKTGTITLGNRMAIEIIPIAHNSIKEVARAAYISSFFDRTPEGKSILSIAKRYEMNVSESELKGVSYEFTPHTRMSGIDLENGEVYRKGAVDVIKKLVKDKNEIFQPEIESIVNSIAIQGGTPLLISKNYSVVGVINLKDIIKPNIKGKFKELIYLGVTPIMCTGDNNLTAKVIANEVGIEEYIAEAKPEDKIKLIREHQSKGLVVAMIGDGTNDAPALAQADVGIVMNNGTVAAKEAANIIDLDSNPVKITEIIKTTRELLSSKKTITAFSIACDTVKLLPVIISIFSLAYATKTNVPNIFFMGLGYSSILSLMLFNVIIIFLMLPIAIKGIKLENHTGSSCKKNLIFFMASGIFMTLIFIKAIYLLVENFI